MTPASGAKTTTRSSTKSAASSPVEETKISSILMRGTLRKKGLIFFNERDVTISQEGILNYYHFDKPGVIMGTVDLTSP